MCFFSGWYWHDQAYVIDVKVGMKKQFSALARNTDATALLRHSSSSHLGVCKRRSSTLDSRTAAEKTICCAFARGHA
jgi:hypothetical protein